MAEKKTYPQALIWIDLETDSLPKGNDFSNVNILEVGAVVTDFELTKFKGYQEVTKVTPEIVANLKENPVIVEMHKTSGLLEDMTKSTLTVRDLEKELIQLLKDSTFDKKEYILAGSGVGTFDFPLIQEKMPELASWLQYYVLDVGVFRRTLWYLSNRRQFVSETRASTVNKSHRAMDDILAHIEEADKYRAWLKEMP